MHGIRKCIEHVYGSIDDFLKHQDKECTFEIGAEIGSDTRVRIAKNSEVGPHNNPTLIVGLYSDDVDSAPFRPPITRVYMSVLVEITNMSAPDFLDNSYYPEKPPKAWEIEELDSIVTILNPISYRNHMKEYDPVLKESGDPAAEIPPLAIAARYVKNEHGQIEQIDSKDLQLFHKVMQSEDSMYEYNIDQLRMRGDYGLFKPIVGIKPIIQEDGIPTLIKEVVPAFRDGEPSFRLKL